jgi:cytoskeletal protein CcmA (bactofilin family)
MMRVSAKAMSVFCPHCQRRAPLETLRITGSHPGKTLATCGDIYIEASAKLNLEITGTRVFVQGRVRGGITAAELIEIGPSGRVEGAVRAPKILVQEGGIIEGRCEIMRKAESAPVVEAEDRVAKPGGRQ